MELAKVDIFEGLDETVWGPKLREARDLAVRAGLATEGLINGKQ